MQHVAFPLVIFRPASNVTFPDRWENGATYRMNMYVLGILPLGWQELKITTQFNHDTAVLKDIGPGFAVKFWDHTVELVQINESLTQYDEELKLTAGALSPFIWVGMKLLFWWRKYRWITLVNKSKK